MSKKRYTLGSPSEDNSWQAESDLRSLMEAEAIEKDPKRYKAAGALAKQKMMEMAAIATEAETGEEE